jgi:hypothetical protein
MLINRTKLVQSLETVLPGLSKKEVVEQSSCFVFRGKRVYTYNDEIFCSAKCPDLGFEGAVQAEPLLNILRRLQDTQLNFEVKEDQLIFSVDKRRKGGVRLQAEIQLPIDQTETPDKAAWTELPKHFSEAVSYVQKCAGRDEEMFSLTCIHIWPKWVEAFDNLQISRFNINTGVKTPYMVRKSSITHIHALAMTEIAETPSWLHFKNDSGLFLSCRRFLYDDEAEKVDVSQFLNVSGETIEFPDRLGDTADKAAVFSASNDTDGNQVKVELKQGKLRITGEGVHGWYQEVQDVKYKGPEVSFMIDPSLLAEVTKTSVLCEVCPGMLKLSANVFSKKKPDFTYVTCVGVENKQPQTKD